MARALQVLLVDDDANDIFCISRATEMTGIKCAMLTALGGTEAMQILEGQAKGPHGELPDLLLLDLKMPGMDGFDFLKWLRNHNHFCVIPTFVLSGSMLQADIENAYRLGARGYLVKPVELQATVEKLRALYQFWSKAAFPSPCSGGKETGYR